jgi:D-alanine-D-alanine ligase
MSIYVDPEWWKTMFDDVYLITDARSVCDQDLTRREVDLICELLPIRPGDRILDLCGGHGRHSFEFYDRGFLKCTLLDYSRHLIDHARAQAAEKSCGMEMICSDARDTGLRSESFDHVCVLGNSIGYHTEKEADRQIFKEAIRLLRAGGWFLVDVTDGAAVRETFNPLAWHEIEEDIVVCRERQLLEDRIHAREMVLSKTKGLIRDNTYAMRLYDVHDLEKLMEETGFRHIKTITGHTPHKRGGDYGFMNHRMIGLGQKG